MISKPHILYILFTICTLSVQAQSSVVFTPAEWNFGTIAEQGGRVSHTFTGVNRSAKPVVILEVFTSCGCTMPEYSKKPILPGATTTLKVTYDPMNRPGTFAKELVVFDSARRKIAKLTIRGEVTPRTKGVDELYPVDLGGGVRLTESLCAFSYLYHGRPAMSVSGVVNTSRKPVRLELRPTEASGLLTLDYPRTLAAGARGEIRISYLIPKNSPRYGSVKDLISLIVNGYAMPIPIMAHGMAVDNPELSNEIEQPKAVIDKYFLKFAVLKRAEGVRKLPLRISNTGDGELIIRAVERQEGIGCTLRAGQRIAAGQSVTAYVSIDPARLDYGALSEYVTLTTNDLSRPMRRVRVTAIIEE
ncbi:MAG: DUF1573 domain-containing protein [Alistipes sp.]